ncbi:hypothetical protein B0H16DRAFT_1329105 [Mycena metata]|uniref:Uncharacterized protein n=1 Tax=Mycena metata TaxID=1033252 RepID=A0AAD7HZA8_9AGAR|nr:hypothetical protein B0H16DRAFT_1329105 [Mycena metata]
MSDQAANDAEIIRIRTAACQKLVDQRVNDEITNGEFLQSLRETGASTAEAQDYISQAQARLQQSGHQTPPRIPRDAPGSREATPEGLTPEEANKFRTDRAALLERNERRRQEEARRALEDVEWSVLQAKLHTLLPARQSARAPFTPGDLERILGIQLPSSTSPTSFPASLLAAAPHMAQLSAGVTADPHIEQTWKLRRAFGADKILDLVVDVMQLQSLVDPLPRTIWRSIIQDHYVNFEKINAAFEIGYDHQDEPKDFAGEYALVKKEQATAKRAIKTETEWIRVFAAWRTGVCLLYPHRTAELSGYLKVVTDLFRAVPQDPSVAIRFDAEARDKYAKSPYHLDDRDQHNLTMLSQMFNRPPGPSNPSKRSFSSVEQTASSSKRSAVACQNWNLGFCEAPCSGRRMHGTCSECGKSHRAKDNEQCLSTLQARRRKSSNGAGSASGIQGT